MRIELADPAGDAERALIDELSAALEQITGASGRASSDPASLSCFIVARDDDGRPVGCGGFRELEPGVVEIKRMYARPGTRGVGAALLQRLEDEARARGAREARLETRLVNTRAMGFYEHHGYARIPNYGRYVGREDAGCFAKSLYNAPAKW